MKIKTQFINSMIIFGIILLIIATSVIITNQQVERLNKQEEIARNIERGSSELSYLSNDYLLYHESPQRARWESKFLELSDDLSNLNPNSPEQQTLVNNIRSNQQRLKAVFTDVISTFENTSGGADQTLFQISWSRMAVQNQGMAFDAARLSQMLRDQADQLKQMNIILIFALLCVLGLYFLTNYLIVYRRALRSISDLQDGTRIIGSGNFDFAIKQKSDDEIGELSHAFNRMTANLKEVTASKAELEREITERERAEDALRESEQRWATTLASIGDAVIATDVKGRITFMNAVAEELTGWSLNEAATQPVPQVFKIIDEQNRQTVEDPVARVLRHGMIIGLANHTLMVRKEGTEIPIDDSGAPIKNWKGETTGVVLVFRDITERRQAEEERERLVVKLKETATDANRNRAQLEAVFQAMQDGLVVFDMEGNAVLVNEAEARINSFASAEDMKQNMAYFAKVYELEEPSGQQVAVGQWPVSRIMRGESLDDWELRGRRKDTGQEWFFSFSGAPVYDEEGKQVLAVTITRDITERRRADDDIKRNEARLESLLRISQHRAGSIQELLDFALDEAVVLTGSKIGYIYHYDETRKEFTLNTWSKDVMEQCTIAEQQTTYQLEKTGIWGEAVRQARPIIVNDFQAPHPLKKGYPDGHAPLYKYMTVPVFSDGLIVGVVGVANKETDYDIADVRQLTLLMDTVWKITERRHAEEALQESEKRYRSLFENMMDGFAYCKMLFDDDGHPADFVYLDVNSAFGRLTGLENVIGKKVTEVIPGIKSSNPELFEIYGRVALTGQPETFEIEFKPLGVWLSISVYSPEREYFVAVFENITERKRAEEALRKAHDELEIRVQERTGELKKANEMILERTAELEDANVELEAKIEEQQQAEEQIRKQADLLDKAQDAIAVRDLEHRLIYWNKGAQRLYGWKAEEIIGKNADKLLYKEESPNLIKAKSRVIEKGEWIGELPQRTKDGKEIIVESRWTLVRDNEDRPRSILIINTDITEKKKLEAQLLRAQRMESIGTLAGGIAHDLNNMLTPIMLSLQILKGKFKDEQSKKLLTILENNTRRGADLIKQVLSFAHGVEGERIPLQAKHIITEIENIVKETFPKNIEIRTDIHKALFTISGDATQLHQVLMNLCVNARDAMPDGGILKISAENFFANENYARLHADAKVGPYVVISVSDTGIGIPAEILDRIFEPFFTTKKFGKGTGLGLSTALAIVKSHAGFINVYSEIEKGTTFEVYLPAIKTEMKNIKEQQLELPAGHGELVLVAEDEDSVREVTASTLEKYGYNVLAANDGAEAVALYAKNMDKIKVILMDMMMPVMDGETSIQAIRKINPEVKVIVVSGLAEKDKLAKNESTHAHALLPKPYTADKLLKTIHEVMH